jgi:hypothetical protein
VYNSTDDDQHIEILDNKIILDKNYYSSNHTGSIKAVAESNGNLYFQLVPDEAKDLVLYYYTFPTELSGESDEIDFVPLKAATQAKWAIVHGVCKRIFDQIEDGIYGKKVNTQLHEARYNQYFNKLKTFSRSDRVIPPIVPIAI